MTNIQRNINLNLQFPRHLKIIKFNFFAKNMSTTIFLSARLFDFLSKSKNYFYFILNTIAGGFFCYLRRRKW